MTSFLLRANLPPHIVAAGSIGVNKMYLMRAMIAIVLILVTTTAVAADILVFSKTSGFRHGSISVARTAITQLGAEHGFSVTSTEDASQFNDATLVDYDAVIFLLTTGDVLNNNQQAAFERYIQAGGGYVGVHSASDTEYSWPWYGELVGAYFDRHPAQQNATLAVEDSGHPSTNELPTSWARFDEWYDFQTNPRDKVNVLLTIDENSYSGGGMGNDHPLAWYRQYDGGRSWYTALGHTNASYSEVEFLSHLLGGIRYAANIAVDGPLTVSGDRRSFVYRDSERPFFMAGVGGPEGFFYETDQRKQQIVDELINSGANALYMHSIRSFEGDGFSFEDPFNTNENINSGVDAAVLANWRGYLEQLDANRIVTWFHILDDTARPWGCSVPLSQPAIDYIETIVTTFRDLDHLVWLSGEEYQMGRCSTAQDQALMRAIAAEIRRHDPVHPIGVHHNNGESMAFAGDPNINVFAQQICGNSAVRNPQGIHNAAQLGAWVYVMAECHPWHLDLLHDNDRTSIRQSNWASAMAGGSVLLYNAYECAHTGRLCSRNASGNETSANDPHDPGPNVLNDLARLHQFMTDSRFAELDPRDELSSGGTLWSLANPDSGLYVGYANDGPTTMGFSGLGPDAGYQLRWFNPVTGNVVNQTRSGSDSPFAVPAGFANEVAVFAVTDDLTPLPNRAPVTANDAYQTAPDTLLSVTAGSGVLANDSDADGDPLSAVVVSQPDNGSLTLNTDGGFSYLPASGYAGTDEFSYRADDGELQSSPASVSLLVAEPSVLGLWLIDADTDQRELAISDNQIVSTDRVDSFSIEAELAGAGSVVFSWSGLFGGTRTESFAPFALFGDASGDFAGEPVQPGELTISSAAYSQASGGGDLLSTRTVTIEFVVDDRDTVLFFDGFEQL